MSNGTGKPIDILLVEDNPGDVRLIQEAMKDSKIHYNISVVKDGQEALDFLYKKEGFKNSPKPDLILLDLNLPRVTGQEVLEKIKNDTFFAKTPVIVLTTSKADEDILKSYALHANCFITKPADFDQFIQVINTIQNFWLKIVKLPIF